MALVDRPGRTRPAWRAPGSSPCRHARRGRPDDVLRCRCANLHMVRFEPDAGSRGTDCKAVGAGRSPARRDGGHEASPPPPSAGRRQGWNRYGLHRARRTFAKDRCRTRRATWRHAGRAVPVSPFGPAQPDGCVTACRLRISKAPWRSRVFAPDQGPANCHPLSRYHLAAIHGPRNGRGFRQWRKPVLHC